MRTIYGTAADVKGSISTGEVGCCCAAPAPCASIPTNITLVVSGLTGCVGLDGHSFPFGDNPNGTYTLTGPSAWSYTGTGPAAYGYAVTCSTVLGVSRLLITITNSVLGDVFNATVISTNPCTADNSNTTCNPPVVVCIGGTVTVSW